MNYSKSHVMTNVEYLVVMHKKVMEKVVVEAIRETCHKEREETRFKTLHVISTHMNGISMCSYQKCKSRF